MGTAPAWSELILDTWRIGVAPVRLELPHSLVEDQSARAAHGKMPPRRTPPEASTPLYQELAAAQLEPSSAVMLVCAAVHVA